MKPSYSYLKQHHFLFGSREFILKGKDALLIREKSLFKRHETLLPLNELQANPTHSSSFAIKWLLTALFMATMTGLTVYFAMAYSLHILFLFSAVLAGSTLVLLYRFFLFTTKLTIFRHAVSNENYLYLWRNQPNEQQFESFVTELSRSIKNHTINTQSATSP